MVSSQSIETVRLKSSLKQKETRSNHMRSNPHILFVNLPSVTLENLDQYFSKKDIIFTQLHGEPLGIMYLSSYLKAHTNVGSVNLIDFSLGLLAASSKEYNDTDCYIRQYISENIQIDPQIIAISVNYTPSHQFMVKASEIFKEIWPASLIVVGGFHATNATREILENQSVDLVVRGQGEVAFVELINRFKDEQDLLRITGVYSRSKLAMQVIDTSKLKSSFDMPLSSFGLETCTSIENLDDLPFPDRELINMFEYSIEQGRTTSLESKFTKRKASIITTRGCFYACTFCASRTIFPRKMQYRSTKNVIDEIRSLNKSFGINFLVIEDDLFTGDSKSCLSILRAISKLRKEEMPEFEIQFPNDLNINTCNEEIFDAMIDCGLRVAHIAVESGSTFTQHHLINKNAKIERVKPYVKYLQGKGIVVKCVYIFGFPGETLELMQETLNFARDVGSDWSIFNIATPLLGTPMYDQFVEMGYIKRDIEFLSKVDFRARHFDTKEISAEEINKLQYLANLDVNFVSNKNLAQGNFEQAEKLFIEISTKYPFHIFSHYCLAISLKAQKKLSRFAEIRSQVIALVNNPAATRMYLDYSILLPDFLEVFELDEWVPESVSNDRLESEKLVVF